MTAPAEAVLAAARRLADDVLFPDATRVDRLDVLPAAHLDALAAEGLFGAPAPREAGGLGLDLRELSAVVEEEVAGGCLATAFVWIQHFRRLMTLAAAGAPAALRDRWLEAVKCHMPSVSSLVRSVILAIWERGQRRRVRRPPRIEPGPGRHSGLTNDRRDP
jgi:hypothetical protein